MSEAIDANEGTACEAVSRRAFIAGAVAVPVSCITATKAESCGLVVMGVVGIGILAISVYVLLEGVGRKIDERTADAFTPAPTRAR
jgi:hypothetical protein